MQAVQAEGGMTTANLAGCPFCKAPPSFHTQPCREHHYCEMMLYVCLGCDWEPDLWAYDELTARGEWNRAVTQMSRRLASV